MSLFIGTSGWQYKDWQDRFYPSEVRSGGELSFYSDRFQIVEINATFYKLPKSETFEKWVSQTPEDFLFVIKASRYLTHIKRLKDPKDAVSKLLDHSRPMQSKLAAILVQLPPNFQRDDDRLRETLEAFPSDVRVAVEFRHDSWFEEGVRELLKDKNAALCLADRGSRLITPVWKTADWTYLRFHAGMASPEPCYGRSAISSRAETLADVWGTRSDILVFFNNDTRACALRDARRFALAAKRSGLKPSRIPGSSEVRVG